MPCAADTDTIVIQDLTGVWKSNLRRFQADKEVVLAGKLSTGHKHVSKANA